MDDDLTCNNAKGADLGLVNHAFMTSMDEGDQHNRQEIGLKVISISSGGQEDVGHFIKPSFHVCEFRQKTSPVSAEDEREGRNGIAEGLNVTCGMHTSCVSGKIGSDNDEEAIKQPYVKPPCQTLQPNQPHQCFDLNPNNSTPQDCKSSNDDLVKSNSQERMEEDLNFGKETKGISPTSVKQEGRRNSKGVPGSTEFTAINLGHHKEEDQDDGKENIKDASCAQLNEKSVGGAIEHGDLNTSIRSDATEFFYTPDISPTRSPTGINVHQKRGVKFSEKSIEIGEDMLETAFDHCDENATTEERVLGCLDQEYLQRMVDPNSQFFVRTYVINYSLFPY